jgi:hypothetical protein
MAKDLAKINQMRVANGLAPLEKLPEDPTDDKGGKGPDDGNNPPSPDPEKPNPPQPPAPPAPADLDLDDKQLLAVLNKKGIKATSLEDLLPKPDPTLQAERREAAKLSYSLDKGLFSTKEHENFIREKNNPKDLVFAQYYEEARADDPELTDEDIRAEFEEKYGLSADPGTRKYKRGEKEISLLADKILRDRYNKIFQADQKYAEYEAGEQQKRSRAQTILSKANDYKKDVEAVFQGLTKIKLPVSENESYEVEIPAAALQSCKDLFLDPDTAAEQILAGYTPDKIREVAYSALVREALPAIFLEGAKQYHLKRQAGAKGIIPVGQQSHTPRRSLTEDQKRVLAEHGIKEEDLPPVNN